MSALSLKTWKQVLNYSFKKNLYYQTKPIHPNQTKFIDSKQLVVLPYLSSGSETSLWPGLSVRPSVSMAFHNFLCVVNFHFHSPIAAPREAAYSSLSPACSNQNLRKNVGKISNCMTIFVASFWWKKGHNIIFHFALYSS